MIDKKKTKNKWLHLRLSETEYKIIYDRFASSTCRKLSEFARKKLLDKAITINHRNQSLDDFMAEMMRLRNELASIGNNFNQVVKKMHTLHQLDELKQWIAETDRQRDILLHHTDAIKQKINSIAELWLQ